MQKLLPQSLDELQAMIKDQVQESLHLDYKRSPALSMKNKDEIAKDVSAMANSDGGWIVYGIEESGHLPEKLDDGVPDSSITREWIENVLSSNISPSIPGLKIVQISCQNEHSYYAIEIPKSYSGPHQAPNKRYYKRYNFKSSPMDDYEIRDIRGRQLTVTRLVSVDVEIEHSIYFILSISNPGSHPAENVSFRFSQELAWGENKKPRAFDCGLKYLPPGRKLRFWYLSGPDILGDNPKGPVEFSITAEYNHPELEQRHSETFYFDFRDFLGSSGHTEPYKVIADEVKKGFKQIAEAVKNHR
jgi:hypothetical protein